MARHKWRGSRSSARASGACSASSPWRPRRSRRTTCFFRRSSSRCATAETKPSPSRRRSPSAFAPRGSCTWRTRSRWRERRRRVCRYRTDAGKKSWTSCSPRTCWRARSRRPRFRRRFRRARRSSPSRRRRRTARSDSRGARSGLAPKPSRARSCRSAGSCTRRTPRCARAWPRRARRRPSCASGGRSPEPTSPPRGATAAPRRGRCRRSWRAPRGACRGWWRAWTRWRRPRGRRTRTPRRLSGVCWRSTRPWAR